MAMTAEEKAASKERRQVRDRAYRARYKAFMTAQSSGEAEIDAKLKEAFARAREVEGLAEQRLRAAEREMVTELEAMKQRHEDIKRSLQSDWAATRKPLDDLYAVKNSEKSALAARLDAAFPDLCGNARWSASVWGDSELGQRIIRGENVVAGAGDAPA